jgi:hypothetical protein
VQTDRIKKMKKFKIAMTNMGGFAQIGAQAVKADFAANATVFTTRAAAQLAAQDLADWVEQFDGQRGFAALVCAKKGTRWIVISQH